MYEGHLMKKESKVISVRIAAVDYEKLRSEADERLLTISELIRIIIEQRQRMGGRRHEERLIMIEDLLNKVLYHAVRSDIGHIAQFRLMQGDESAEKTARAIKDEYRMYQEHLNKKGED
jgi:hypothetical protein